MGKQALIDRVINLLFGADCFLFTVCTLGGSYPFESFSSAAWRGELKGNFYGRTMRPVIDTVFWFSPDHCKTAYIHAQFNLPEDER